MTVFSFLLPPPPVAWAAEGNDHVVFSGLKKSSKLASVEPVGAEFLAAARRLKSGRTLEEDREMQEALMDASADDADALEDAPESEALLRSDPMQWKKLDHYDVLGLQKLRFRATDDDIKRAYRRKVLKHHPDKKAAASGNANDDSFFKCIQKSWEVLTDSKRRREFDSCDPTFDDVIPSPKAKGDFFKLYAPVFEKEARFSKTLPVPALGGPDAPREEVERFYEFWLAFDSWRTFEMMDEKDVDSIENRDERRYYDKKNKAQRTRLKKEDMLRVNRLIDQALRLDPRLAAFKAADKESRNAKKNNAAAAAKAAAEEAALKAAEEQRIKDAAEAEEKERAAAEKATREAAKNAIKKEKKTVRRLARDTNHFLPATADLNSVNANMTKIEELLEALDLNGLEAFRSHLEEAAPAGEDALTLVLEEEHMNLKELSAAAPAAPASPSKSAPASPKKFTPKESAALISAVKNFPGGTLDRWVKIAAYVNEHGGVNGVVRQFTPKDCISMSKKLAMAQVADRAKIQAASGKPVKVPEQAAAAAPTTAVRPPSPAKPTAPAPTMTLPPNDTWTTTEQLALEAGLRKYPASAFSGNPSLRWERIAEEVEGRNKNDIKARVKQLADFVSKKKGGK